MSRDFRRLDLADFAWVLRRFPFRRRIDTVHLHHTWRPEMGDFRGEATIHGMWRFHTGQLGWSDIAQHVTIDPAGGIWPGRDWNRPPASAAGHNGNAHSGPFMIEMIGNFDAGHDLWEGAQRDTALELIALVQMDAGLPHTALRFHREMSGKSCPGSAIDKDAVLKELKKLHGSVREWAPDTADRPARGRAFAAEHHRAHGVLETWLADTARARADDDPMDAEPGCGRDAAGAGPGASARDARGAAEDRVARDRALRRHVVNMRQGRLVASGDFETTEADVRAIFEDHIPRWLSGVDGGRLLFFAHGGLVSESAGLDIADRLRGFFLDNGIYPVFFVWETGLFETIGQLLFGARSRTRALDARDIWDWTTDPAIELAVQGLGAPLLWSGMKRSARRAVDDPGGAATFTAERLKELLARLEKKPELHAVGHSAGSIFLSQWMPKVIGNRRSRVFRSTHFLAPAIRVDAFHDRLAGHVGKGAGHLTVYTMDKATERDDSCKGVYRKSLLYLVHHALEDTDDAPILGLEESIRSDGALRSLLGLQAPSDDAEVLWSPTASGSGRSATRSTTHGGFDNDPATLHSVVRRVLDLDDTDPIREYSELGGRRGWADALPDLPPPALPPFSPIPDPGVPFPPAVTALGRRHALCVGIDAYRSQPLAGCVADARLWAETLQARGFSTEMLLDHDATRSAILGRLGELVRGSGPGDVLVFQYAGHGTQVRDLDGDEGDDARDEALCPIDLHEGRIIIDDDLAEIFGGTPAGAAVYCFFDSCHSGTATRLLLGGGGTPDADERARFIRATPELERLHAQFRRTRGAGRSRGTRSVREMGEVLFAGCQPHELSYEKNGQGQFSLRATRILRGAAPMTNDQFIQRVQAAFGSGSKQNPMLDCAPERRGELLLAPRAVALPA